jgi:hypothetical protein
MEKIVLMIVLLISNLLIANVAAYQFFVSAYGRRKIPPRPEVRSCEIA